MIDSDRAWVVPGAKCYVRHGGFSGGYTEATIERLTATHIILSGFSNRKYRRDDLRQVGDRYRSSLVSFDDEGARDHLAAAAASSAAWAVQQAAGEFRKSPSVSAAEKVRKALDAWTGLTTI